MSSGISLPAHRTVVTGLGAVCAAGTCSDEILSALRAGEDASSEVGLFSTEGCQSHRACLLPESRIRRMRDASPHRMHRQRVSLLLATAADEALAHAGDSFVPEAAVFGTTSGAMSCGEEFFKAVQAGHPARRLRHLARDYVPQQAAIDLIEEHRWPFSPIIVSNACASGTNAIGLASALIRGGARRVICGGYDTVAQLVFAGFDSLRALSPDRCRPFDKNRSGLLLGEGAGVLCIESLESALSRRAEILCEISGYGVATDNHHLTQPEPGGSGPLASMRNALASARLQPGEIDYVNAHGTGTPLNDSSEGRALLTLLPRASVSSTKGLTGHALGAAGALEAVFCCMALRTRFLPGNINLLTPDPELPLHIVPPTGENRTISTALSNSFGFGGSNASIVFRDFSKPS